MVSNQLTLLKTKMEHQTKNVIHGGSWVSNPTQVMSAMKEVTTKVKEAIEMKKFKTTTNLLVT